MVKGYDFARIEKKWQKTWEKEKAFAVKENSKKEKYYVLEQFPYPSGGGLHVGHSFIYTIGDIHARFKRMQGFNVLYPMGFDSFGLPAENAAIKAKIHPQKFTEDAIANFTKQMKLFGYSYDWDRMVETHKPEFYHWDQWIFLKMLEKGLAYRKHAFVNWCPKCVTVLANEQVVKGCCYLHENTKVEQKRLDQWFFKTTKYADALLDNLDKMDWPPLIVKLQRNWIGRSEGIEIVFDVAGKSWPVFTTRPDTLMGVTFLVVSSQHPELDDLVTDDRKSEVDVFLKMLGSVSEKDSGVMDKEGVFTGAYAKHPLTGEDLPIWAGNFVVAEYGSGMVMAVPAHDQRDYEFAKKYGLEIKQVIDGPMVKAAYTGDGVLVNSEGFNGLSSNEAKEHITNALKMKKKGKKTVQYKLRDWLISRQRYWGTPIPIIYCDACGAVPVPEKDLPVVLPKDVKFGKGNPLATSKSFVEVVCPTCGAAARRETDTMDTFSNSSWYFLRYTDPKNSKKIFDSKKANYWMPIDMYVGGKEHATMHDIYFRFYTMFLKDLGLLDEAEPAKRLFNQGFILGADGEKMSKSKGNVVLLDEAAKKYGVDPTRFFLVSVASPESDYAWDDRGAESSAKFVRKVLQYYSDVKIVSRADAKTESKMHKALKEITGDLEAFRYNLAVIKIRQLFASFGPENSKGVLQMFLQLLSPFCPHVAEELWSQLGGKGLVSLSKWPEVDEKKIDLKLEEAEKSVDGVVKDILHVLGFVKEKSGADPKEVHVYVIPAELRQYDAKTLSERVGVAVSVWSVADKKKVDPDGKSKKAKPGKPGIWVR